MSTVRRPLAPWLFLLPALLFGLVFYAGPALASLLLSFTDWNPLRVPRWVGLANYATLLGADPLFWPSVLNTALLAFGSAALGVPAALALALAVEAGGRRSFWRALFWLPAITNVVAVGYAWRFVLDPTYGALNRVLAMLGLRGPDWLDDPATALLCLVAVTAWSSLGHNMLLFSAGLEALDPAVLDAARVDGATPWQRLRLVVLPLLRPTLAFVLVTTLISGTNGFALVLVLTEGGPEDATTVAALHMYRLGFEQLRMGRACAVAVLLLLATALLALLQRALPRRAA